jgi:hypothetical protein
VHPFVDARLQFYAAKSLKKQSYVHIQHSNDAAFVGGRAAQKTMIILLMT